MSGEIELISDGDGLAVLGDPAAVERFLDAEHLPSVELGLSRLGAAMSLGGAVAQAGSQIAAASGRWVKLTKESAQAIDKYGLRQSSDSGLSTGVIKGSSGQVRGFVEFVKTPGAALTNPATLAGLGGIMSQLAMQQAMQEITDYLATIEEKVDEVLRAQKDAVLSRMIGVGLTIDEAMTLREHRGRVDDITWSKVQGAAATIAETQAYALRQLDGVAETLERHRKVGDLAKVASTTQSTTREWLAVLARTVQLQDALAVLELDRVLDASPLEVDRHRLGLAAARDKRLERISRSTEQLLARISAAAELANAKILLHPTSAPGVVRTSQQTEEDLQEFDTTLGLQHQPRAIEARGWTQAASEARDRAVEAGADSLEAAKRLGSGSLARARHVSGGLAGRLAERSRGARGDDGSDDGDR